MKKNVIKILLCVISIILICSFPIKTYAKPIEGTQVGGDDTSGTGSTSIMDIFTEAENFIEIGQEGSSVIGEGNIKNMSDILYNTLLVIGVILAVIIGMIIGIKFMTGSVDQKAKIKETLIAYVAGCIVVFGAFTIWKLVVTLLQNTT